MIDRLVVATEQGMSVCRRTAGDFQEEARSLTGREATSVIAREGMILAGTTDGAYRSEDGGQNWSEASDGLVTRHVRWLAYHPEISDCEFAGTEPAGIYVSHDGAASWRGCPEVEELRDRFGWFLPYSPEAGCVRGFAFHGSRVYAAVEVGGVLRSDDAGENWRLAGGSSGQPDFAIPSGSQVHADVHSVSAHQSSPDLVFAATAEGLYRSIDGGDVWSVSHLDSYCRAMWIDPSDPDHIVLSPNDSVSQMNGRIEESSDSGRTWTRRSEGLDLPWPHRTVERFVPIDEELFAITNDGQLYASTAADLRWRQLLPELDGIRAVAPLA